MFGHDDHDEDNKPHDGGQNGDSDQPDEETVKPTDSPADDGWQHPGPPPDDDENSDDDKYDSADEPSEPIGFSLNHPSANDDSHSDNDLIDLKQEALSKLSPLIGHLDQSPDEKFRTLMMMIQASDDQKLVRQAYDTALKIDDEKERAQALLDIVNEINYFTQNSKPQ